MDQEFHEITMKEIFHMIFKRWWLIVAAGFLAAGIALVLSIYYIVPIYKADTSLFLGKEKDKVGALEIWDLQVNDQLVIDYREIVKSRSLSQSILDTLKLNMTLKEFQRCVEVTTIQQSRLFKISFVHTDPQVAADVCNLIASEIMEKATDVIDVSNIQVIDTAVPPTEPFKPEKKKNTIIAGLLGGIIGILLTILVEYLDHTIKKPEDIERYLSLKILAEIPKFNGEKRVS